jgi:hypothetical protein
MGKRDWIGEADSYGLETLTQQLVTRCNNDKALANDVLGEAVSVFVACSDYLPGAIPSRRTQEAFRSALSALLSVTPVTDDPGFG